MYARRVSSGWTFRGTDRFKVVAPIGMGGMGVVFEVYDRDHRCNVALKLLPTLRPRAIVRFKNEFRALQGIHHPNLVTLGELIEDRERLFFTMELIDGSNIISYAHRVSPSERVTTEAAGAHEPTVRDDETGDRSPAAAALSIPVPDEARLRSAFLQLAQALVALHVHDKIHRDVKPSNVLVTEEGRVVLLDFGLVVDIARRGDPEDSGMAGTASYMSPEQADLQDVTPASDWYGFGALLHEALTGWPPFLGSPSEVLEQKRTEEPPVPTSSYWSIPADLGSLCHALLARDPKCRPTPTEILAVLDPRAEAHEAVLTPRTVPEHPLVGRGDELARLHAAWDRVETGPVLVVVEGESGVGKTSLVREFSARVRQQAVRPLAVLSGRCSERETVAFQAVDAIVEQLAEHLMELGPGQGEIRRTPRRPRRRRRPSRCSIVCGFRRAKPPSPWATRSREGS